MWTAQIGLGLAEDELKPVNVQQVEIMVERDMLDDKDTNHWHNKPHLIENPWDVIFDWVRGQL